MRVLAAIVVAASLACADPRPPSTAEAAADSPPIMMVDRAAESGLGEIYYPADLGHAKIIATMGGGVAWGDVDGDGDADLFVTQGVRSAKDPTEDATCGLLFRNEGGWKFVDVTERSGITACGWGSGATFEDLDADGDLDLFLTFAGDNQLWVNQGDGSFVDRSRAAGITAPGYNCGAAFLDYDGDTDLDLYLTRYVETTVEQEAAWKGLKLRMPEDYPAPPNVLLRNDGSGAFVEVTAMAGVADAEGRGLGVVAADFDLDGRTDLFVANDRSANTLLRNRGDGTFEDVSMMAGISVGADGMWESAMGVAVADVNGNGFPDILVTNYVDEPNTLFLNLGELVFVDGTREYGLGDEALERVGWAAELEDFDNDGRLDLYVANGHIMPTWIPRLGNFFRRDELISAYSRGGYRQPFLLFQGTDGGFRSVVDDDEGAIGRRIAARGGATADVDRDGRLDLFVLSIPEGSPSALLANRSADVGHWLGLDLRAPGRRPSPLGSHLVVEAGDRKRHLQILSGGSYLSSSARSLHVGTGTAELAQVTLDDGAGRVVRFRDLPVDHYYALR